MDLVDGGNGYIHIPMNFEGHALCTFDTNQPVWPIEHRYDTRTADGI